MSDLERTGVELFVDGMDNFRQGMGEASGLLTGLGSAALDVGGGALDALGGAMGAVANIAAGVLASGLAVAATGIAAFTAGVVAGAFEAEDAQVVINRLSRQLTAMGDGTDITIGQVQDLAQQFAGLAGGSDDVVIGIQQIAIQSQAVSSGALPDFIQASLDLGAVMGDTTAAATIMALAYDQPSSALAKLKRAHILFTPEQEKQIKAFEAAGDNASALAIVQGVLSDVTSGAALESTQTLSGAWGVFTTTIGEAFETIGANFLPIMQTVAAFITSTVVPAVTQLGEIFGAFGASLLEGNVGTGLVNLREGLASIFGAEMAGAITQFLAQLILGIQTFADFVIANLPAVQTTFEQVLTAITPALAALGDLFTNTLLPAFETVWLSIGGGGLSAQATLDAVLAGVVNFATIASDFIVNVFVPAITSAVDWFVLNWPLIQATAEAVFIAIGEVINNVVLPFINDILIPTMQNMINWVVTNWPIIQATITTIINAIYTTVTTILTALQQFWTDHGAAIMVIINGLWTLASTAFTAALDFIMAEVSETLTLVKDFWATWGDEIMAVLTALFNSVGVAVEGWAIIFNADWGLLLDTILLTWSNMWRDAIQAITDAVTAITSKLTPLTGAFDAISEAVERLVNWFWGLVEVLKKVVIPGELNPGSPTPFEIGLLGISAALTDVTGKMSALNALNKSMAPISLLSGGVDSTGDSAMARVPMLPVGGGSTSTVNNNINVQANYPRTVGTVDVFTNIRQGLNAARA